jgi:hypothetical protein
MLQYRSNGPVNSYKAAKKIEYIGETKEESESEPEIIDLQAHAKSKAASVSSINKLRVITDFINRGY